MPPITLVSPSSTQSGSGGKRALLLIGFKTGILPSISAKDWATVGSRTSLPKSIPCFLSKQFVFLVLVVELFVPSQIDPHFNNLLRSISIAGIFCFKEAIFIFRIQASIALSY